MEPNFDRRSILAAMSLTAVPSFSAAAETAGGYEPSQAGRFPLAPPRAELAWEAFVELAPTLDLGDSPLGQRRMVPITGGRFEGPRLRGVVLAGGADRQLVRKDGVVLLNALYEMKTNDGAVITVLNRVTIDSSASPEPYAQVPGRGHSAGRPAFVAQSARLRGNPSPASSGRPCGCGPGLSIDVVHRPTAFAHLVRAPGWSAPVHNGAENEAARTHVSQCPSLAAEVTSSVIAGASAEKARGVINQQLAPCGPLVAAWHFYCLDPVHASRA